MNQSLTNIEKYLPFLENSSAANSDSDWLSKLKAEGAKNFERLGFPTARKGNERWKYTDVGPIARSDFEFGYGVEPAYVSPDTVTQSVPTGPNWHQLVLVDGVFSESLSSKVLATPEIEISSLSKALDCNNKAIREYLAKSISPDSDGFVALNTAALREGIFLHIAPNATIEHPIHIIFISTGFKQITISNPRILLLAESGSRTTVIETYAALSENKYFTNCVSEIVLQENATIDHYRLQNESESAFHVTNAKVSQSSGSTYTSSSFFRGSALGRYDLSVFLNGPDSNCYLNGLYVTANSQHQDNNINIEHAQPNTTSRLAYKGILDGRSKAVFGGTVLVQQNAQKTDAIQSDKNLVLSPNAEVDSKPALFIYADDVKCGHGATAGNIDEETIFYMRSRGLDIDTASKMLIYGFAKEVIDTVHNNELKQYLESLFLNSLPSYRFEF
ncbi:MAG: Fe-S cluster assembly protein SufD [Chloroflexota bacterium]|nr:Fe-S cluster assembly protein SufD [Chloroflexota bacterium]